MNYFCFIIFSPPVLPGPVVRVRCDPGVQVGPPNFFRGQGQWASQLLFCKNFTSCAQEARKIRKWSSTWSSQAGLPSKYYPFPMLLDPKMAWLLSSPLCHSVTARQCEFWPKNLVFFANIWQTGWRIGSEISLKPLPALSPPSLWVSLTSVQRCGRL